MADDTELLRHYVESGSEAAFTEFVGRHLSLVYFTALRGTGGDTALAQDIAQAVFTTVARKARTLLTHPTLTGWLHMTTRYAAARAIRNERTRRRYEQKAAMHDEITAGAESEWEKLRPVIDEALGELEACDRDAILVRFFEGRAFAEMGAAWEISQDGARMRVERALDKLRAALARRGIASMPTALAAVLTAQGALAAPAGMVAAVSATALTTASVAAATAGGAAAFLNIMSGTKIILGATAAVALLVTGSVLHHRHEIATVEHRLEASTHALHTLQAQMAGLDQRRSAAEARAAEAEKDNAALLAAVEAVRAKSPTPALGTEVSAAALPPIAAGDTVGQTLRELFPTGVVAIVGNRTITLTEVRQEMPTTPEVAKMLSGSDQSRHQFYKRLNGVVAELVTRQLDLIEFRYTPAGTPPRQIPSEAVETALADVIREQFGNDQVRYLAFLNERGWTPEQHRQGLEEHITYSFMRGQQRKANAPNSAHAGSTAP